MSKTKSGIACAVAASIALSAAPAASAADLSSQAKYLDGYLTSSQVETHAYGVLSTAENIVSSTIMLALLRAAYSVLLDRGLIDPVLNI